MEICQPIKRLKEEEEEEKKKEEEEKKKKKKITIQILASKIMKT